MKAGKRKYLLRANTLEDLNYWCDGLDNVIQGKAPAEPIVAPDSQNALDKIREDILEKLKYIHFLIQLFFLLNFFVDSTWPVDSMERFIWKGSM